jgi:hypothetical protein
VNARARFGGATVLSLAVAGIFVACASTPDTSEVTNIYLSPNAYTDFAGGPTTTGGFNSGVQGMLAMKCGGLDCHGSLGESLRIFSQYGLRLVDDAGDIPGGAATTPEEIYSNFISAISVQPELTSKVFYGLQDPHTLLLLRKPLALERHKGGQVLQSGDPGDVCLTTWLQDGLEEPDGALLTIDNTACNTEGQLPQ